MKADINKRLDIDREAQVLKTYSGRAQGLVAGLLALWTCFQLYFTTIGSLDAISLRAYHSMFLVFFVFLFYPLRKGDLITNKLPILDLILMVLGLVAFGYLILNYERVARTGGFLTRLDLLMAGLGLVLVLEAGRRASPKLALLALGFLAYNFLGQFIPGFLGHTGFSLKRVLSHLFWGSQGIFGLGVGVSASYIFLFVLFGSFLKYSGFSQFINDFALALVGRTPGGPAKVAVIASALLGMINGSAVANVATTGTITIPMMKETGYKKEFAAAVEAVASTGGQFCPPIMGAVGFVMAEFLGLPYFRVMLVAIIPAFLYYLGIMVSVHLEAKKLGLEGLPREELPRLGQVLRTRGHLSLPLFALIFLMMRGRTAVFSAVIAIFLTVASSWLRKETRMYPGQILAAIVEGSRSSLSVGISCVLIGIIIGTVSLTGLGLNFGHMVLSLVKTGQLLFGGLMVMVMSVILGMGVPGVAAYVIVVAVAVPVLIKVGALPIAAHMFCLIYACLSNITPPVAMSSYVAAGIAKADLTKTSINSVKLGITGFIIPFFFLTNPILLIGAVEGVSVLVTLRAIVTAIIGVVCLASGVEGYLYYGCSWPVRLVLVLGGLLTLHPGVLTDLLGLGILISLILVQKSNLRKNLEE